MKTKACEKLIVALDTASLKQVKGLLRELEGVVCFYKIGFELFSAHGWEAVDLVRRGGRRVFLDLKLHDIPHTVARTAAVICEHKIDMFNVHALGGIEMMREARKKAEAYTKNKKRRPKLLAVTLLTSHTPQFMSKDLGSKRSLEDEVLHLARCARKAGLDGVVSSPQEIALLRKNFPQDFLIVTPGIRPQGASKGGQKRTLGPREAFERGADFVVIGRPITESPNPRGAASSIISLIR